MKTIFFISLLAFLFSCTAIYAQNSKTDSIVFHEAPGTLTVKEIPVEFDVKPLVIFSYDGDYVKKNNNNVYCLLTPKGGMEIPTSYCKLIDFQSEQIGDSLLSIVDIKIKGKAKEILGYSIANNALIISDTGETFGIDDYRNYVKYIKKHITPSEKDYFTSNPQGKLEMFLFFNSIFYEVDDAKKEIQRQRIISRMVKATRKTINKLIPMACTGYSPETDAVIFRHSLENYPHLLVPYFIDEYVRSESGGKHGYPDCRKDSIYSQKLQEKFINKLEKIAE